MDLFEHFVVIAKNRWHRIGELLGVVYTDC